MQPPIWQTSMPGQSASCVHAMVFDVLQKPEVFVVAETGGVVKLTTSSATSADEPSS